MASDLEPDDAATRAVNQRVGERLRAIRKQKKMSLQELESVSNEEFKASVVGAYERGERSVSLPRLQRLAEIYAVPVEQLLPRSLSGGVEGTAPNRKMAIDLVALRSKKGPAFEMLARFLTMIQVQRGDFNGKVLTVRSDDVRAIAAMLNVDTEDVANSLRDLGLLFRPTM
jgi:transcriptional regulator with XRE-family HTH domain